ncbi:MAG TPA: hypothetical protein VJX94_32115, partial [Stellaceae bacterium]|nr:hypothetical protein [Stellaceae bacterium]
SDEAHCRAGLEARAYAGTQCGFALEDVDELILARMVWRSADMPPGGNRVRLTSKWVRPK